jgi:hypothetical protein
MFLFKKHLSRRTLLKGAGATIALPLLDAMVPAGKALAQTAAAAHPRLGFVYFPHGALHEEWTPKRTGLNPDFPFILQPLEPYREYVTVVSGLRNKGGESASPHGIIEETWLNCVAPRSRNAKTGVGVTADQIAARHLGKDTTLASLELCGEPGGMISFRTPTQALPMESNPRKAFYAMFGQGDTRQEREEILSTTGSLLDYVKESTASLTRTLDPTDRARVTEYLDSVREIEQRVQRLEENARSLRDDLPGAPLGPPEEFGELLDIQFEMIALSFQTNRTRVASLKMVEEASMRTYPNLDVHEAFHPTSHWGGFPDRVANLRKIQNYHTAVFAKFVKRLSEMREGNRSILDDSIILFGSNMANSDAHNNDPLPQALIGRGGGIKGNQHLAFPQDTPHANILVTMLNRAGVPAQDYEKFADNKGVITEV